MQLSTNPRQRSEQQPLHSEDPVLPPKSFYKSTSGSYLNPFERKLQGIPKTLPLKNKLFNATSKEMQIEADHSDTISEQNLTEKKILEDDTIIFKPTKMTTRSRPIHVTHSPQVPKPVKRVTRTKPIYAPKSPKKATETFKQKLMSPPKVGSESKSVNATSPIKDKNNQKENENNFSVRVSLSPSKLIDLINGSTTALSPSRKEYLDVNIQKESVNKSPVRKSRSPSKVNSPVKESTIAASPSNIPKDHKRFFRHRTPESEEIRKKTISLASDIFYSGKKGSPKTSSKRMLRSKMQTKLNRKNSGKIKSTKPKQSSQRMLRSKLKTQVNLKREEVTSVTSTPKLDISLSHQSNGLTPYDKSPTKNNSDCVEHSISGQAQKANDATNVTPNQMRHFPRTRASAILTEIHQKPENTHCSNKFVELANLCENLPISNATYRTPEKKNMRNSFPSPRRSPRRKQPELTNNKMDVHHYPENLQSAPCSSDFADLENVAEVESLTLNAIDHTPEKNSPGTLFSSPRRSPRVKKPEQNNIVSPENGKDTSVSRQHSKLFPIFTRSPSLNSTALKRSSPSNKSPLAYKRTRKSKSGTGWEQLIIDAGQKDLGPQMCDTCGMLFSTCSTDDVDLHIRHHAIFLGNLSFQGWKNEKVVGLYGDGRVILIRPGDHGYMTNKVKDVCEIVDRDLGFSVEQLPKNKNAAFLLFVSDDKRVVGCLIAEPISKAYCLLPSQAPNKIASYCSQDSVPAVCGINRIWTAPKWRKKKVASRLVDCIRCHFIYGQVLSLSEIAFSSPTVSGQEFAEKYTGRKSFLVYA